MDTHVIAAGLPALGWILHGGLLTRRLSTARRDPLPTCHGTGTLPAPTAAQLAGGRA